MRLSSLSILEMAGSAIRLTGNKLGPKHGQRFMFLPMTVANCLVEIEWLVIDRLIPLLRKNDSKALFHNMHLSLLLSYYFMFLSSLDDLVLLLI